jgi:hypothetical protein
MFVRTRSGRDWPKTLPLDTPSLRTKGTASAVAPSSRRSVSLGVRARTKGGFGQRELSAHNRRYQPSDSGGTRWSWPRTLGEVAEQLSDFRGETRSDVHAAWREAQEVIACTGKTCGHGGNLYVDVKLHC